MEPIKFWEFMSQILEGLGYQRFFSIFYSLTFKNPPNGCYDGAYFYDSTTIMFF